MERERPFRKWAWIALVCAAVSLVSIQAGGTVDKTGRSTAGQPDLIRIDTLASSGQLEMPPVVFLHDKHTDALAKENKDCKTCHLVENEKMSLAFKARSGVKPEEIKQIYHSTCTGCHMEMAAAGKKSGPANNLCRSCHNDDPKKTSSVLDIGLDKVLHYRHAESKQIVPGADQKDNCGRCHHEYDKQARKIYYAKGKEGTCRYCHQDKQRNNVKSLRQASHLQCVTCHMELAGRGVKAGPYNCAGCHGAEALAGIEKRNKEMVAKLRDDAPRLKREQPDVTLILPEPGNDAQDPAPPPSMGPVPFDHKAHEKYNDSCRACHHMSMEACGKCHTPAGSKESSFVRLEESMHLKTSGHSCVGCHAGKTVEPACAGCHNHMEKTSRPFAACRLCHMQIPEKVLPSGKNAVLPQSRKTEIAENMLKGRNMSPGIFALEDIPENVQIKGLTDRYEPAVMPHRKIILSLIKGMKDSRLAEYFHSDTGTMCLGCHHKTPVSKQPPPCGTCHGKPYDPRQPNRLGLQSAFHQGCMKCHKSMGVAKPAPTACTECHKEKKKTKPGAE